MKEPETSPFSISMMQTYQVQVISILATIKLNMRLSYLHRSPSGASERSPSELLVHWQLQLHQVHHVHVLESLQSLPLLG